MCIFNIKYINIKRITANTLTKALLEAGIKGF